MKEPNQNVTFEQLIAKVKQAEDVLEARERGVVDSYQHLRQVWREGWTPLRIISAGLVMGFVSGRAEPLRALSAGQKLWWFAAAGAGVLALVATVFNQAMPLKLYPALVNLVMLMVFGLSLRFPPTVVERLARLQQPDLPAAGVRYTRRVTQVWCAFFILNGSLATVTAVWASDQVWVLYNGFLAYVMIAVLFAGEWLVRQRVKAGHANG